MRGSVLLLASVIAVSFFALVPTAEAAATCTAANNVIGGTPCPDVVCYGNSGGYWQFCLVRDTPIPCQDYPCRDPLESVDLCQYMDNCVILDG